MWKNQKEIVILLSENIFHLITQIFLFLQFIIISIIIIRKFEENIYKHWIFLHNININNNLLIIASIFRFRYNKK